MHRMEHQAVSGGCQVINCLILQRTLTSCSVCVFNLSGSLLYRKVVDTCRGGATSWPTLRKSSAWMVLEESERFAIA